MKTLLQLLKDFDGTKATCIDDLTACFKEIAQRVLYGGHFEINDKTDIYPTDIEFYYYNEDSKSPKELNDSRMYHKGKDVPYFPTMSFYPHESGVDVTFENEDKEKGVAFRASFLIRAYRYEYHSTGEEGADSNPRHLWEDMFGYHSFGKKGIRIKWADDNVFTVNEPKQDTRVNLKKDVDKKIVPDTKPWRFIK